jgi:hypothetical protein
MNRTVGFALCRRYTFADLGGDCFAGATQMIVIRRGISMPIGIPTH